MEQNITAGTPLTVPHTATATLMFEDACAQSKEERRQRAVKAQQRREAWQAQAGAQAELDWERYGKYDMLHELLQAATSEPSLQVCPRSLNASLFPGNSRCNECLAGLVLGAGLAFPEGEITSCL